MFFDDVDFLDESDFDLPEDNEPVKLSEVQQYLNALRYARMLCNTDAKHAMIDRLELPTSWRIRQAYNIAPDKAVHYYKHYLCLIDPSLWGTKQRTDSYQRLRKQEQFLRKQCLKACKAKDKIKAHSLYAEWLIINRFKNTVITFVSNDVKARQQVYNAINKAVSDYKRVIYNASLYSAAKPVTYTARIQTKATRKPLVYPDQ